MIILEASSESILKAMYSREDKTQIFASELDLSKEKFTTGINQLLKYGFFQGITEDTSLPESTEIGDWTSVKEYELTEKGLEYCREHF